MKFLAKHPSHVNREFLAFVFWAGLNPRTWNMLIVKGIELGRVDPGTLVQHALKCDDTSLVLVEPNFCKASSWTLIMQSRFSLARCLGSVS